MSNQAKKFEEILKRLEKEDKERRDIKINLDDVRMDESGLIDVNGEKLKLSENGFIQMAKELKIPADYLNKLAESRQDLVTEQFNHFLHRNDDNGKMLRIKNGLVQGIVSENYKPFDNFNVLQAISSRTDRLPEFDVVSHFENESRFHMRIAFPQFEKNMGISRESGKGDIVRVGIDILNSETGQGNLIIAPITYRLVCTNGMKSWKREGGEIKQRHIHFDYSNIVTAIHENLDVALVDGQKLLEAMAELKKEKIELPFEEIKKIAKQLRLSEVQTSKVIDCYKVDDEPTRYGIVNGFTRFARDIERVRGNNELRVKIEAEMGRKYLQVA